LISGEKVSLKDLARSKMAVKELSTEDWIVLRKKAQEQAMIHIPGEYLGKYRDPTAKEMVRKQVAATVESQYPGLPYHAKQGIIDRLTNEISGYGPLEQFLDDKNITEIIVERYDRIIVEENGELKPVDAVFDSEEYLRLVTERIISPLGRRLDYSNPTADARLPDGSRVSAVIPPVSVDGAQLTIRKFRPNVSMDDLVKWGMLTPKLRCALAACVKGRLSVIISGGTGSGKTTFLNALSEYINPALSIITIENPVELQLRHPHVRRWEARPANMEGTGEVSMLSLLLTALRSRPDIIIVGEVRGKEAYVLMQALNTGHMGSMTTLHANNVSEAMKRLVSMVASAGEMAHDLVPDYIAGGVDIIVQIMRFADGKRRVTEIGEVVGVEKGVIKTNPLVKFVTDSVSEDSKIEGHWEITGNEFTRSKTLRERGVEFPGWK
jgi:pilus assembly protein CpaF